MLPPILRLETLISQMEEALQQFDRDPEILKIEHADTYLAARTMRLMIGTAWKPQVEKIKRSY